VIHHARTGFRFITPVLNFKSLLYHIQAFSEKVGPASMALNLAAGGFGNATGLK
jgi:hypothetical protein